MFKYNIASRWKSQFLEKYKTTQSGRKYIGKKWLSYFPTEHLSNVAVHTCNSLHDTIMLNWYKNQYTKNIQLVWKNKLIDLEPGTPKNTDTWIWTTQMCIIVSFESGNRYIQLTLANVHKYSLYAQN